MEKFNIAIIKPNNFGKDSTKFNLQLTDEFILNEIKDYIVLKEVTMDNMMEVIVQTINLDSQLIGDTILCYETCQYVYQLCYLNMENNGKKNNEEQMNGIGSLLTIGRLSVYGNCVFLCSKITNKYICEPYTVNLNDIAKILYKKIIHSGVIVLSNGDVQTFKFIKDPLEKFQSDFVKNFQWIEYSFLKFNLVVFIQIKPTNDEINKKTTKLIGKYRIHGDAIIVSKLTGNEFLDLDIELFNKLLIVSEGPLYKRNLTDEEKKDGEKLNGLPIVFNRYLVLEERLKKYTKKCYNCGYQINNDAIICTGCYRVFYHNKTCQVQDWVYHKDDCLYNKTQINKYISNKINKL